MVRSIPPFAGASVRFLIAGGLLFGWARLRHVAPPSRSDFAGGIVSGTLLLTLGNGTFTWVMQFLPGGLGAIFFALAPLWMVVLAWVLFSERPHKRAVLGVAVGFGGILLVVSPGAGVHLPLWPTVVALFSSFVWSLGSIVDRRFKKSDLVQSSALQLLTAGVELAIVSRVFGEPLVPATWTADSYLSLGYLIIFGSIVGYSAYLWLTRNVRTSLASTYAYVNPVVAIAIGTLFLHEPITATALAGVLIVVAGVALMTTAPSNIQVQEPAEVG